MRFHPLTNKAMCVWGYECGTDDDPHKCEEQAVGIVAVTDGPGKFMKLSVCPRHRQVLIDETAPLA